MDALFLELNSSISFPAQEDGTSKTDETTHPISLTVVHPFVVNTGLAKKPVTRFSTLLPFTEAAEAASIIIKAVKHNDYEVYVPSRLFYLFALANIFPLKVRTSVYHFLGIGVEPHDED